MRAIAPAVAAARADRAGIKVRHLIWIVATERATGDPAPIGFWSGDDHEEFVIGGVTRTYFGAGTHQSMDALICSAGVKVRRHRVTLAFKPEVESVLRGYETRFAPCQIHRADYSTETGPLLAEPEMVLDGEVGGVSIKRGAVGGTITGELTALSNAVFLTRPLASKRSDESLRARNPNDAFLQYAKISGTLGEPWGVER